MTWEQLIHQATDRLNSAGVDDAHLNAEYLAVKAAGLSERYELRYRRNDETSDKAITEFNKLVERRERREPLQYILGDWEFFGLPIFVCPGVLIPRPETEVLVEEALREAGSMNRAISILDIGTGSGAIAIALASKLSRSSVMGIDISTIAIEIAKKNAGRLGLQNVKFRLQDILAPDFSRSELATFDLIVSNPPYVSLDDFARLEPELLLYEPREALTDGGDGLRFYQRIADVAPALLIPNGRLLVELGFGLAEPVRKIVQSSEMKDIRVVNDLAGIPRVLVASMGAG